MCGEAKCLTDHCADFCSCFS